MGRPEVVLLEPEIQTQVFADRRHTEGRQSGDPVMSVVVMDNGCLPFRTPRPSAGRNEKKAAFIGEKQMGPKFLRLFLYAATCIASSAQWLPRPAGGLGARALGTTNLRVATAARRDWGGRQHRTPCE